MTKAATSRQRQALENFGIIVPPTRKGASSLLSFLLQGNMTRGVTITDRVALLRDAQIRYCDKTVRSNHYGNTGVVLYIFARYEQDIAAALKLGEDGFGPFQAMVRWTADGEAKAGTRLVSLLDLEILDPVNTS